MVLLAAWTPQFAKGDGGLVLLHEAKDPFSITVFVAPEMTGGDLTDVSILVQSSTGGDLLLDANVSLAVDSPRGLPRAPSEPFCGAVSAPNISGLSEMSQSQARVTATREQASNKLLYSAALHLNTNQESRLHVYVSRRTDNAQFDCLVPLTQASPNASGLWSCLLIPPLAIAVFAINQKLRKHSLEGGQNKG